MRRTRILHDVQEHRRLYQQINDACLIAMPEDDSMFEDTRQTSKNAHKEDHEIEARDSSNEASFHRCSTRLSTKTRDDAEVLRHVSTRKMHGFSTLVPRWLHHHLQVEEAIQGCQSTQEVSTHDQITR